LLAYGYEVRLILFGSFVLFQGRPNRN